MPDSKTKQREANSLLHRAENLVLQGRWNEAKVCFGKAIDRDPSPGSRIAFASSLAAREEYNAAIHEMTSALDLASNLGDRPAVATIYHNLATVYRELGDSDLASRFQQRAVLLLDDCGSEELLGLANDAWLAGRAQLAASLADSSSELADSDESAIEAEATLGVFCGMSGDPRSGIRFLLRTYRYHREQSEFRLMGFDLMNLAILFGEIGWNRLEVSLVREAIRLFEQIEARVSLARAQNQLALLMRAQAIRTFDPSLN